MKESGVTIIELRTPYDAGKLSLENVKQLYELQRTKLGPIAPKVLRTRLQKSVKEGLRYLIALKGNRVVGSFEYYRDPRKKRVIAASWLGVDKSERRKGIATALENRLYNIAVEHGAEAIIHHASTSAGGRLLTALGTTRVKGGLNFTFVKPAPKIPPHVGYISDAGLMRLQGRNAQEAMKAASEAYRRAAALRRMLHRRARQR
jgi:GNAT superfamily N-acetyltransferase